MDPIHCASGYRLGSLHYNIEILVLPIAMYVFRCSGSIVD